VAVEISLARDRLCARQKLGWRHRSCNCVRHWPQAADEGRDNAAHFAKAIVVVPTTAIFPSLHYAQGRPGIEQAAIAGFVFGTIFAVIGRLFMLMVTHAAFDLTAAAIIYFQAEAQFAHLIFK
jgi:hypothetical protein